MVTKSSLVSYAMSFASFLIDSKLGKDINKIILFGSVARGDYNEDSDIDLFIDTEEKMENEIEKILSLFSSSRIHEIWSLKGIKNEISIKVGKLEEWKLRREVISSGILLYGKYSKLPENVTYYMMIRLVDINRKKTSQQIKIWRKLYGYKQKIGKKIYISKGLVEKANGTKIGKAIFIIPMEKRRNILDFLNKNRVSYKVHELWSDTFN